jgi:hypothetical protein
MYCTEVLQSNCDTVTAYTVLPVQR